MSLVVAGCGGQVGGFIDVDDREAHVEVNNFGAFTADGGVPTVNFGPHDDVHYRAEGFLTAHPEFDYKLHGFASVDGAEVGQAMTGWLNALARFGLALGSNRPGNGQHVLTVVVDMCEARDLDLMVAPCDNFNDVEARWAFAVVAINASS